MHRGRGYTGLSSADAAIAFCRRNLAMQTLGECRYPFYAVAMSLARGHKVVFSAVDLAPMDAICCSHRLDALIIHHVSPRYDQPGGFEKILRRRWALAEISTRLLFRQRPWYLSGEHLTLRRCPCGCGAVIVVLEPDLPELQWPLAEGGPKVLQSALAQTFALLQPHTDALLTDPRARLLAPADPAGSSGHRPAVCAPGPP